MIQQLSTLEFEFVFNENSAEVKATNKDRQVKIWNFAGSKHETGLKNFFYSLTDDQCKSWFPKLNAQTEG
jgi:hypothetical protein